MTMNQPYKYTNDSKGGYKYALCLFSKDLRGGRKGDDKVIQVEVNGPIRIHVKSEATPNQVKKCPEQKVEKDAKVEKKSPGKPIEEEKKEINVKIEIEKEKGANNKIIEEKKDEDAAICIYDLRGK